MDPQDVGMITGIVHGFNALAWGPATLVALLGVGAILTISSRLVQLRLFSEAVRRLFERPHAAPGEEPKVHITPFAALMTAISSTVGVSNIAGVAMAIALGGPGALFWMWVTAIVGMASKYAEAVLAIRYRERRADGSYRGGPMSYMERGVGGPLGRGLAIVYAGFGMIVAFGTGGYIQSNSVAVALRESFAMPPALTGAILALGAGAVVFGGIKRIARVAARLTPVGAVFYLSVGLLALALNAPALPGAFRMIVEAAFGYDAAAGGFVGSAFVMAIRYGVARGVFSNEAGQGSASIAHAQVETTSGHAQGLVAMLGCVIDTLIVSTVTGLVILTSGAYGADDLKGVALTVAAFDDVAAGFGTFAVTVPLIVFGFSTIFGWTYYGERCCAHLFGEGRAVAVYRGFAVLITFLGAAVLMAEGSGFSNVVTLLWLVADSFTAFMVAPNLVALVLLTPTVLALLREGEEARALAPAASRA